MTTPLRERAAIMLATLRRNDLETDNEKIDRIYADLVSVNEEAFERGKYHRALEPPEHHHDHELPPDAPWYDRRVKAVAQAFRSFMAGYHKHDDVYTIEARRFLAALAAATEAQKVGE